MAKAAKPIPDGFHSITPHLALDNATQTIAWYMRAFGAQEVRRSVGPDGKVMHCELRIGNSLIMVNDVMGGAKGPQALGGSPAGLWLYVEDSDAAFTRAVDAGAQVQVPLDNQFWGDRGGAVADPEGYTWWIATRKEELEPAEMGRRAEEFFKQFAQPST